MSLIYPMFAMVILTYVVSLVMLRSRVRAVKRRDVPLGYFKTYDGAADLPAYIIKPSRHYSNLFEAPTMFYVGCLAAIVVGKTGPLPVSLAWAFVVARCVHAYIHIGNNNVSARMQAFVISMACLLALWIVVVI